MVITLEKVDTYKVIDAISILMEKKGIKIPEAPMERSIYDRIMLSILKEGNEIDLKMLSKFAEYVKLKFIFNPDGSLEIISE